MRSMPMPARTICATVMLPLAKTMAFGAVPPGIMKPNEAPSVAGIINRRGSTRRPTAVAARTGIMSAVIAEFTVNSEHPPAYTREVAADFDAALARIRGAAPSLDAHKAALLAGLAITAELFQGRQGDGEHAARLSTMRDRLARLLPPSRRGGVAKGAPLPAD